MDDQAAAEPQQTDTSVSAEKKVQFEGEAKEAEKPDEPRSDETAALRASGGIIARKVDGYAAKLRLSLSSGELRRTKLPNLKAMIRPVVPQAAEPEVVDAFSSIPQEIVFVVKYLSS